jgi:hypothetical protein
MSHNSLSHTHNSAERADFPLNVLTSKKKVGMTPQLRTGHKEDGRGWDRDLGLATKELALQKARREVLLDIHF